MNVILSFTVGLVVTFGLTLPPALMRTYWGGAALGMGYGIVAGLLIRLGADLPLLLVLEAAWLVVYVGVTTWLLTREEN